MPTKISIVGYNTDDLLPVATMPSPLKQKAIHLVHSITSSTKLGQWEATAIGGNDILSSIFYTVGLCTVVAGPYTPLCLSIVALGILYPFRMIYAELGEAIPVNGGEYRKHTEL